MLRGSLRASGLADVPVCRAQGLTPPHNAKRVPRNFFTTTSVKSV